MKKLTTAFLVLILSSPLFSQNESNGYIGLSVGPSFPIGDFASKDTDNDEAGLANPGVMFEISFAHKLGGSNFGISALLRGQGLPTDAQTIADEFGQQAPGADWTVESESWGIGAFMFGGYGSFPVSDNISFDTRAMIGFASASSPKLDVTGSANGNIIWIEQESADASAFAYLVGAGFQFGVGDNISLLTNLDYLGTGPEFSEVETKTSDGNTSTSTWEQSIGTINLSVGIAYKL